MANTKSTVKLFKSELIMMLADHQVTAHPALYGMPANGNTAQATYYDDAKRYVANAYGTTKSDLVLSAKCHGLIPFSVEVR